jgi:predicted KAP-like P-loop ATPase
MPLDEAVIAKLALFERCTDTTATEALHDAINAAPAGKPDILPKLEGARTDDELRTHLPESWQKHLVFVKDWVQLEPKLAGIDLRPAVYLARETVPLRLSAAALSPKAVAAVESLLHTATVSSRAAREAIENLDGVEQVMVMEQLIVEMRKNAVWDQVRSDFRGAVLLARHSAEAGKALARFVRSLPRRPAWMTPLIRDDSWMSE